MKRLTKAGKIIVSLGSLVFILFLFFVFWKIWFPHETSSGKDLNKEEKIEVNDSHFPGIHLETVTKETDKYVYAINTPTIENEIIDDIIQSWLTNEKEKFLEEVEASPSNNFQSLLNIHLTTIPITDSIYNFIFEGYQITGGANGFTKYQTYTFDISQDNFLSLEDFIDLSDENITEFKEIILAVIANDPELSEGIIEELLDDSLKQIKELKWSINEENFSVYWDEYEIAIGAVGAVHLVIPIDQIEPLLTTEAKNFLDRSGLNEEDDDTQIVDQRPADDLDPDGKYVALTFDDGPHSSVTPRILNILSEHNAKATFFMLGNQVEYYPKLVQRVAQEGHEIGNHSQTHIDLTVSDNDRLNEELNYTNELIKDITGYNPVYIRPPYGAYNDQVIKQATDLNQPIIMWSVDSLDWQSRDPEAINQEITSQVSNGAIILMHDIHETTADALPTVLENLEANGYKFVTVSELLKWQKAMGVGPHFGNY
ncbi:polysaccharide deacetylase family sporulation protein PdaB [Atopostipes suicloacalis DSM 15692]|uniref:Polysaccharide deacetylase family sporulation protein PdaB n=1 Tax=Atopostipes suicloacalis DSM 15692 TaxID=1121025 RepID=A0A1M4SNN2_9LACT|nr:polysaccharide deacetylase family protein [Atopostipes suicloacalis]SHE33811.1 polysaccharide deacetylase family sporulation protein PdaB [Atopostipes suicloacalis DSM 15692]